MTNVRTSLMSAFLLCALVSCASARGAEEYAEPKRSPTAESRKTAEAPTATPTQTPTGPTVSADWSSVSDGQSADVFGTVKLVGNDPFYELVIMDESGKPWYVEESSTTAIKRFEQRKIRVRGVVRITKMTLANGTALSDRRTLTELTVLE